MLSATTIEVVVVYATRFMDVADIVHLGMTNRDFRHMLMFREANRSPIWRRVAIRFGMPLSRAKKPPKRIFNNSEDTWTPIYRNVFVSNGGTLQYNIVDAKKVRAVPVYHVYLRYVQQWHSRNALARQTVRKQAATESNTKLQTFDALSARRIEDFDDERNEDLLRQLECSRCAICLSSMRPEDIDLRSIKERKFTFAVLFCNDCGAKYKPVYLFHNGISPVRRQSILDNYPISYAHHHRRKDALTLLSEYGTMSCGKTYCICPILSFHLPIEMHDGLVTSFNVLCADMFRMQNQTEPTADCPIRKQIRVRWEEATSKAKTELIAQDHRRRSRLETICNREQAIYLHRSTCAVCRKVDRFKFVPAYGYDLEPRVCGSCRYKEKMIYMKPDDVDMLVSRWFGNDSDEDDDRMETGEDARQYVFRTYPHAYPYHLRHGDTKCTCRILSVHLPLYLREWIPNRIPVRKLRVRVVESK